MKIYVASSFLNKPATRAAHAKLREAGHEITWDWTQEDASHLPFKSPEYYAFLEACGERDRIGVLEADAVVALMHEECRDTLTEIGIAIGAGKRVIAVEPYRRYSVFFGSVEKVASLDEALERLRS